MTRFKLLLISMTALSTGAVYYFVSVQPEQTGNGHTAVSAMASLPAARKLPPTPAAKNTTPPARKQSEEDAPAPAHPVTQTALSSAVRYQTTVASPPLIPIPAPTPHREMLIEPHTGMEFLPVPGGCFRMGDNSGEADEKPAHQVCLDSFFIGKYEVTQKQWLQIFGSLPSFFSSCGDYCPVENVSWHDTQNFIRKLNSLDNRNYRLATEAEWEYACRSGGKAERYCGGDDVGATAWYDINSLSKPHPVGEKKPNGLGIYDMGGNVWEWVHDYYLNDYYGASRPSNPDGPATGTKRVMRGGSWYNDYRNVRASIRGSDAPEHRSINLGFRLVNPGR